MMKDAEAHAAEDHQRREEAEIRNSADSLVYQTEKFIADNTAALSEGEAATSKIEVDAAMTELKETLKGSDFSAIKTATEKVSKLSQVMGAAMYAASASASANANAEQTTSESGEKGPSDDDVVDAEIVDDQK